MRFHVDATFTSPHPDTDNPTQAMLQYLGMAATALPDVLPRHVCVNDVSARYDPGQGLHTLILELEASRAPEGTPEFSASHAAACLAQVLEGAQDGPRIHSLDASRAEPAFDHAATTATLTRLSEHYTRAADAAHPGALQLELRGFPGASTVDVLVSRLGAKGRVVNRAWVNDIERASPVLADAELLQTLETISRTPNR